MQLKDIESLKTMQIRAGSIFKVVFYRKDGVMPKGFGETSRLKYFVIVWVDEEGNFVATSLINTSVNINLAHVIAPYQYCIYPDKYEFLDGQYRYIDCYMVKILPKSRIECEAEYIGVLEDEDLERVKSLLYRSPVIGKDIIESFHI